MDEHRSKEQSRSMRHRYRSFRRGSAATVSRVVRFSSRNIASANDPHPNTSRFLTPFSGSIHRQSCHVHVCDTRWFKRMQTHVERSPVFSGSKIQQASLVKAEINELVQKRGAASHLMRVMRVINIKLIADKVYDVRAVALHGPSTVKHRHHLGTSGKRGAPSSPSVPGVLSCHLPTNRDTEDRCRKNKHR